MEKSPSFCDDDGDGDGALYIIAHLVRPKFQMIHRMTGN